MPSQRDKTDEKIMLLHHGTKAFTLPPINVLRAAQADIENTKGYRQNLHDWNERQKDIREHADPDRPPPSKLPRPNPPPQSRLAFMRDHIETCGGDVRLLIEAAIDHGPIAEHKDTSIPDPFNRETRMLYLDADLLRAALSSFRERS